jgi:SAM-dependent methyltransferase
LVRRGSLSRIREAGGRSSTEAFYEAHAREYFERTVSADLRGLYDRVLKHVPPGGRILDAGCGSGRDLKVFKSRGFDALGIDASATLVQLASEYSGAPCQRRRLERVDWRSRFDAVWACASLVHLPKPRLVPALGRLRAALVRDGVIFASFKAGSGEERASDGRRFVYYEAGELRGLFDEARLAVVDVWTTGDAIDRAVTVRWINVLARR